MEYLDAEDWSIVRLYQTVSDQVYNPYPFGTEDGKPYLLLRLGDVLAGMELCGIPEGDRMRTLRHLKKLHMASLGRFSKDDKEVHRLPWFELRDDPDA